MRRMTLTFTKYADRGRTAAVAMGIVALLAQPGLARQAPHETFSSPEAATHALYLAVQKQDERTLTAILGAEKDLVSGGDEALDKLERERFAQKYREMHRLVAEPDGHTVLYIGAENWPFPIPLVAQNGAWRFDADAGRKYCGGGSARMNSLLSKPAMLSSHRKDRTMPSQRPATRRSRLRRCWRVCRRANLPNRPTATTSACSRAARRAGRARPMAPSPAESRVAQSLSSPIPQRTDHRV